MKFRDEKQASVFFEDARRGQEVNEKIKRTDDGKSYALHDKSSNRRAETG